MVNARELGLRTVVDLRIDSERAGSPDADNTRAALAAACFFIASDLGADVVEPPPDATDETLVAVCDAARSSIDPAGRLVISTTFPGLGAGDCFSPTVSTSLIPP